MLVSTMCRSCQGLQLVEPLRVQPGNVNLLIGVAQTANREIGVPG